MTFPANYCTIPQAAEYCGVDRTTMWNWVKAGFVDAFITPGGHHRIPRHAVEKLLATADYPQKSRTKKILIVDDNPVIRETFRRGLEREKYLVHTAPDGFTAGLKVMQEMPDMVLLDLFMDGIDGFEVCGTIKEDPDLKSIIVLVMTGHDTHENRTRVLSLGADGYLAKSVGFKMALKYINSFFSNKRGGK
jgi:excisionase family DNA binding protein